MLNDFKCLQPSFEPTRQAQSSASRQQPNYTDRSQNSWNSTDPPPSSLHMLTKCFDKIFTDLNIQVNISYFEL